jgi:hypothetical protein
MTIIFFLNPKLKITPVGKNVKKAGPLCAAGGQQSVQPLRKPVWWFLKKSKIGLPWDPAILSAHPGERRAGLEEIFAHSCSRSTFHES